MSTSGISTLGALREAVARGDVPRRSVSEEVRDNLIRKLRAGETLFPGIIGYDDSVVPQMVNALLSQHNFILLGLRGQAKTRLLRALTTLLDEAIPVVPGCEINDDPLEPLCASCRARIASEGDRMPIGWLSRDLRYVEKLATPDVTIADMVGDIDPIKAARSGLQLSSELTMHYGLLPRANRGIFAINELPDLAGKIQVGLFNILQEGDVQIKGYPIRLPLDILMAFTANPEDYTARGKIITPLKDRIGSEIRTHYPTGRADAMAITAQEAWLARNGANADDRSAAVRGRDRRGDRIPGATGSTHRQAVRRQSASSDLGDGERRVQCRAASARIRRAGRGCARHRRLRRAALDHRQVRDGIRRRAEGSRSRRARSDSRVGRKRRRRLPVASRYPADHRVVRPRRKPAAERHDERGRRAGARAAGPGAGRTGARRGLPSNASDPMLASGVDFLLEGLYATKKIGRSDERGYHGADPPVRKPAREVNLDEETRGPGGGRKKYYN